jgi:hypothetical protein
VTRPAPALPCHADWDSYNQIFFPSKYQGAVNNGTLGDASEAALSVTLRRLWCAAQTFCHRGWFASSKIWLKHFAALRSSIAIGA